MRASWDGRRAGVPRVVALAAAGVLLVASVAACAGSFPGLAVAFDFGDGSGPTVHDRSSSGLDGTITGGATWTTAGKYGSALTFDGIDDKVDVGPSPALALTAELTIEAWVRPSAGTGWRTVALEERPGGLAYALYVNEATSRPNVTIDIGGTDRSVTGPTGLPVDTWSHLAATYDGQTIRLYVNATEVASAPSTGAISSSTSSRFRIGGNAVWGEWFRGTIDDVRVYGRALTAGDITTDMNRPAGPAPAPPGAAEVGRWSPPTELGLVAVNMVYLHTGKVLMFRGMNAGGTSASLWDPATGDLTPVPAPYNIFCSGHAQLADGRILVVGGHDHENNILGSAEAAIFDPVAETWTSVAPMSQRRWYPSATTLPDGRVLVTSGAKTDFFDIADIPEVFDPATNTFTDLTAAQLSFPYYPFSFVLPGGGVLIAGAGEHPAPTRVLDVATQSWTTVDPTVVDGGSAAMFAPGKVIKTGTSATTDVSNDPSSATTYVLDTTSPVPQWRATAPMAFPRAYHTLTPLPDGSVIVTGGGRTTEGKDVSAAVHEAEIWSPVTETWTTMAPMTVPRLYHGTALLLADGRVVVAGSGDSYGGPDQTTAEIFEPPYLFKGARPTISGAPAALVHGTPFTVGVTGSIASVALLRLGAVTHQFDEDARYVPLSFTQVGGQVTITAPADATVAPPGYYELVVVDAAGVPSVGSFVRLPTA